MKSTLSVASTLHLKASFGVTHKHDQLTNFTSHNTRTNQGDAQAESPCFIKLDADREQRQRVDSSTPEPESNLLPDVQEASIDTIVQPKVSTQ